jgi:hypothetical protein
MTCLQHFQEYRNEYVGGMRTLPRSVLLALWLARAPLDPAGLRRAVLAIQQDDEPHIVEGFAPGPVGLEHLMTALASRSRPREVVALLPTPGDLGVPPEVAALAADSGECVLVLDTAAWALVPEVEQFGSTRERGHLVTWRARSLPSGQRSIVGMTGTLSEAHHDLRTTLLQAVQTLDDLDVSSWSPEASEALSELRDQTSPTSIPEGLDPHIAQVLLEAIRLCGVVDLATENSGGAVDVWQADQRATALREVGRAARRTVAAATLTAGRSGSAGTASP